MSLESGKSEKKLIKIANTDNRPLHIDVVEYPLGFTGNWLGGIIAARETQAVDITFSPPEGKDYQGIVTLESDTQAGRNTVEVAGKGKARH